MTVDAKTQSVADAVGKQHPEIDDYILNSKHEIADRAENVYLFLKSCEGSCSVAWNKFTELIEISWIPEFPDTEPMDNKHILHIAHKMFSCGRKIVAPGAGNVQKGLELLAFENAYDPLEIFIDKVSQQPRNPDVLETWLIDLLGIKDSPYHRAVSRLVMVGAAKRLMYPGVKFDTALVLESLEEGWMKSSLAKALAPDENWFVDSVDMRMKHKEVIEETSRAAIVELPELTGIRESELNKIKVFMSRTIDSARLAYGRASTNRKRRFIFIGTTNDTNYIQGQGRRFWPIRLVKSLTPNRLKDFEQNVKLQLWNEAFTYVKKHRVSTDVTLPVELRPVAGEEQAARYKMPMESWAPLIPILKQSLFFFPADLDRLFFPGMDTSEWKPYCPEYRLRGKVLKEFLFETGNIHSDGTISFHRSSDPIKVDSHPVVEKPTYIRCKTAIPEGWSWEHQEQLVNAYLESVVRQKSEEVK